MINVIKKTLDASGLYCPEPIMLLHKSIRDIDAGERIQVIATDPSTQRDIPKFCEFLGHDLLDSKESADGHYVYVVQKN
ncbi:MAG: sulfurtransferase TusA [Cellvibrionaceae bacterium]|nr:sulfurtransferase TusA [Cellvibrionaceae bacterium]